MRPSGQIREGKKAAEAADSAVAECAVKEWNAQMERGTARHRPDWSPTVGITIAAGFPFLDAYCPGRRQVKQVDLRKLKPHDRTTLHGLIPLLTCCNCRPHALFANLVSLSRDE